MVRRFLPKKNRFRVGESDGGVANTEGIAIVRFETLAWRVLGKNPGKQGNNL
jgi:hypothetical protein